MPLEPTIEHPIRIVVGAGMPEKVAAIVLEHSIRTRTEAPLEFIHTYEMTRPTWKGFPPTPLNDPLNPYPRDKDPTNFSFVRLWVPELCGRSGWAIYLDSDMLVFLDIRELWSYRTQKYPVLKAAGGCTSVLLINCEAVNWDAWKAVEECRKDPRQYGHVSQRLCGQENIGTFPAGWNHRDTYIPGETRLLHYTARMAQPWAFPGKNKHEKYWFQALRETFAAGRLDISDCERLPCWKEHGPKSTIPA